MEFNVKDKYIIVSGSSGNIGREICKELNCMGANVIGLGRTESKLNNVDVKYRFCGDLRDESYRESIILFIKDNNIKIHSLINCVGITNVSWEETIDVNLNSIYKFTKLIIDIMKEQKYGRIVNITSINSHVAFPNNPAYISSKAGLMMLTKSFALDYGKYNIRVNSISPGYIKTPMTDNSYKNKKEEISSKTILNRWGSPSDIVGSVIFLISDMSEYITGIDLIVDGGWLAKGL